MHMTDQQQIIWQRWLSEGTATLVFLGQAQWALRVHAPPHADTEILLSPKEAHLLRGESTTE